MSKPVHPIRKTINDVLVESFGYSIPGQARAEKKLARHVKPLLDALENSVAWMDDQGCDCGTDEPGTCALCVAQELLAAWRAKL